MGGNSIPMGLDHFSELLVRFQTLPFKLISPVVEELPRPGLPAVKPTLSKGLLEHISGIEPLVGGQQHLKIFPSATSQVLFVREQRILLTLDELPLVPFMPGVFLLPHLVECLSKMLPDVEFVEENRRLGSFVICRLLEGLLPHVHDCQADSLAALFPQKCEERIHTFLRAVFAPKPDRAPPLQIAHYDSVGLAFPDRDLINANDLRLRLTGAPDLFAHILHLECLDGLPIEKVFLGHIPDRGRPTASTDMERKALGVKRIIGQPLKPFLLHPLAAPAVNTADLKLKVDPHISARKVSNPTYFAIIPTALYAATTSAHGFFERRVSRITRAR